MGRKGVVKVAGRQPRKELFSAEELSLEWREMRKAVSGSGGDVEGLLARCGVPDEQSGRDLQTVMIASTLVMSCWHAAAVWCMAGANSAEPLY